MHWALGAALGVLGALAAEAVEVQLYVRKNGRQPWRTGTPGRARAGGHPPLRYYILSVLLRAFGAAVLVSAFTTSGQISGPIGALTLGIGASAWITQAADRRDLGTDPGPAELQRETPRAASTVTVLEVVADQPQEAPGHG
jgi:hypothetical protein